MVDIPIDRETNLPLIHIFVCTQEEREQHVFQREENVGVNSAPARLEDSYGKYGKDRVDY